MVAWLLLAFALALLGKDGGSASLGMRMAGLVGYLVFMLGVVRPLANLAVKRHKSTKLSLELLGVVVASCCSPPRPRMCWESIRSLALSLRASASRAFRAGRRRFANGLDMLIAVLLLPLFFALTGMRTRLDLLNDATMWLWAGIVLLAAVAGKMGGAILAARWMGQSWRDAGALGALLNTRGLVELIVLNIAYNVGRLFADALHHAGGDGAGDDDADLAHSAPAEDPGRPRDWTARLADAQAKHSAA